MNKSSIGILLCAAGSLSLNAAVSLDTAPLRFEPAGDAYVTRGLRFASSLEANQMVLRSKDQTMRLTFAQASRAAHLEPGEKLRSVSNVIHGRDRSTWHTAPNYASLHARDLYPGIDLVYYGNAGDLEYDLVVKPGADPKAIRLRIDGVKPAIDPDGNLSAAFIQKHPVAYQVAADGSRVAVASRYRCNADGTFGFGLGRYDRSRELVIDPTLTFSTYVYGSGQDTIRAIGHDPNGFIYVAGITLSQDFEIDPNTMQIPGGPQGSQNQGGYDIFIAQINPRATPDVNPVGFATYLGGSADDLLNDMFVGKNGLIYLTGNTKSTDFPAGVVGGFQTTMTGNSDAFVAVYDVTQPVGQQLRYSSYYGGGTGVAGNGVTADANGNVYIIGTTNSSETPARFGLPVGLAGPSDAFVAGFNPTVGGDAGLFFATYVGGTSFEQGYGIAVAPDNTLWICGQTYSNDFPVSSNPFQGVKNGSGDAFVAHLDPTRGEGALVYSTFLGGSGFDEAQRIAVAANGQVAVSGFTMSGDLPVTGGAAQSGYKGMGDAFIAVLNPAATEGTPQVPYLTYYGGTGAELVTGLTTDAKGVVYVSGYTGSRDLPVSGNALNNVMVGGQNGFVLKVDPTVSGPGGIQYASFVGSPGNQVAYGVDVDAAGTIYVAGWTNSGLFDALNGSAKATAAGNIDGFLMGINPQ